MKYRWTEDPENGSGRFKKGVKIYEGKSGSRERIRGMDPDPGSNMYINLTDGSGYIYQIPVLTKHEIIKSGFDGIRSTDPDLVNGSGSGEFPKSILKLWICWTGMDPDPINKLWMRSGSVERILWTNMTFQVYLFEMYGSEFL